MATGNFYTQKDFRLMAGEFCYPLYPVDENGEENTAADPIDYEIDEYIVAARFSTGETWYNKVA